MPAVATQERERTTKGVSRAVWASGDFSAVAEQVIGDLGSAVVRAVNVGSGERVLDIGAGSGNAAIRAAQAGATVTASDLTSELLDIGRQRAARAGLTLAWEVADAQALPYGDNSFDVVISCVGIMFAPFHNRAAAELARVVRPGGRIGLASWTPSGFIGQLFAAMKPYVAPAPADAQPPPLWGDEEHVRELLGERFSDLRTRRRALAVDRFADTSAFLKFFKDTYGPTAAVYRRLVERGEPGEIEALDAELFELAWTFFRSGEAVMEWEYLLVTGIAS